MDNKPSKLVYIASFGALLGALSMGLALGYTSPAFVSMDQENDTNPVLDPDPKTSDNQKSLIGSMLAIGALVGGFLSEPSNKLLGRRLSLVCFGVPFIIGWILIAVAKGVTMIVLGRIVTGLCCGLVSGTAPTYVVEIATPNIRGLLGTCFQVMVVIGILLEAVFGTFLGWKALAAASLVPSIGMSVIMFFMPETPQWLSSKGRSEEAEKSLSRLRSTPVSGELTIMAQQADNARQSGTQYSLQMFKNPEFYKPFILALGLMFFQQFSGVNAVLFYQTQIFKSVSEKSDPLLSSIYVCIAQVIATIIGSVLVDRLGRKMLLSASGLGHVLSLVVLGVYFYIKNGYTEDSPEQKDFQSGYGWLALVSLIVFISSFSLGFGPIPWMMIPELSSTRVRSIVASIATAFNWLCVYIVTAAVGPLMNYIGFHWTYWLFAIICLASCIFVIFALPETKGKSSEQIQTEMLGMTPVTRPQSDKTEEPMKALA